jgi:hypothetical protein
VKINVSLGFAFLFCGAAWAADNVQPLDVKLGLWESTTTMEHSGAPPIPAEVLARLSPEQRAMECGAGTMKSSGTVNIEAVGSEHVKGTVQMTMGDGTRSMKMNTAFDSKWLGPVCEGSK